jgi:hypothetical protein
MSMLTLGFKKWHENRTYIIETKYQKHIVELDCAEVAAALRSRLLDRLVPWARYEEAKSLLKSFTDFQIVYAKREQQGSILPC